MNRKVFSKAVMLASVLMTSGAKSVGEFRELEAGTGKRMSFSKFSENNFNNLPMKRIKGKWRVAR